MNQHTPIEERVFRYEVDNTTGCWNWTGNAWRESKDPRPTIVYKGKHTKAYRAAYELKVGPIPEGMFVCHKCDNGMCINPDHLFVGTHSDNMQDALRKGRHPSQVHRAAYAERARRLRAVIPIEALDEIQNRRANGEAWTVISKSYGVTPDGVASFVKRHTLRAAITESEQQ